MMLLIGSESGIPIRVRRLRLCHCRSLAVVLAVAALIGGCKSPWSSEPAGPATAVAAASVDPETESFSCPGVPDTSVQAVTGKVTFSAIGGREQDGEIRYLTCRGEKEDSYLFKSEFGRQTPDAICMATRATNISLSPVCRTPAARFISIALLGWLLSYAVMPSLTSA